MVNGLGKMPSINHSPFRKAEDAFVTELTLLEYVKGDGSHARILWRLPASIRATERERDIIDDDPERNS